MNKVSVGNRPSPLNVGPGSDPVLDLVHAPLVDKSAEIPQVNLNTRHDTWHDIMTSLPTSGYWDLTLASTEPSQLMLLPGAPLTLSTSTGHVNPSSCSTCSNRDTWNLGKS